MKKNECTRGCFMRETTTPRQISDRPNAALTPEKERSHSPTHERASPGGHFSFTVTLDTGVIAKGHSDIFTLTNPNPLTLDGALGKLVATKIIYLSTNPHIELIRLATLLLFNSS